MKQKLFFLIFCAGLVITANSQIEILTNGSFESGDLGDWTISEVNGTDGGNGSCEKNWAVDISSLNTCCCIPAEEFEPTDGTFGAFTSFDSTVADTQWIIEQAVTLPNTINTASISFDFVAKFDFSLGDPITTQREFIVQILTSDGSTVISNVYSDGYESEELVEVNYSQDIDVSADLEGLEGTDVILRFKAIVPETSTGPGKAMIDNVSFLVDDVLGLDEASSDNEISIFPNPSNGSFTLNYRGNSSFTKGVIYDISGKIVSRIDLANFSGSKGIETQLPSGAYFLEIFSDSESEVKRLIIN